MDRYKVITLSGSTRFKEYHLEALKALTLQKYIVLPLGTYGQTDGEYMMSLEELRDMHFQRINMSDALYVIDPNHYIGESTREEIEYAKKLNKKVFYMSQHFRHVIQDEDWEDGVNTVSKFDQITITKK